jgi:glycosyltransferase involved in cell wall biosynthesis
MHTLFRDNRELCTGKRCISCALRYSRPPQLWRYGRLLERSVAAVDSFIAPTEFTRRLHLASGLPLQIEVLGSFHRPADAAPAAPAETDASAAAPGAAPAGPYFLYAGRLERLKGVATLIAAFRADREAHLLIAGTGSEEGALREQAAGSGNIRFLGSVPRDRLTRLFAGALAVLVPSLAYEVFPLVILEAFAQGTPVLARDRGPLAEIVSTSGGGLLFADDAGLAGGLRRLRQEPGLRQALGAAGRRAWLSRWTLAAHLDGYFDLIRRLRSGGPRAAGASAESSGARVAGADAGGPRAAGADAEGKRVAGGGAEGARAASTGAAGASVPPTVSVAPQEAAGARGAVEAAGPP